MMISFGKPRTEPLTRKLLGVDVFVNTQAPKYFTASEGVLAQDYSQFLAPDGKTAQAYIEEHEKDLQRVIPIWSKL